jgi:hypothetical protein
MAIEEGANPSNQSRMALGDPYGDRMEDARGWVEDHPDEWQWYLEQASRLQTDAYRPSPNLMIQFMRSRFRTSVRNEFAADFARIAMEQRPDIHMNVRSAKTDGYTTAALR